MGILLKYNRKGPTGPTGRREAGRQGGREAGKEGDYLVETNEFFK